MTSFIELAPMERNGILALLFLSVISVLFLLFYEANRRRHRKRIILDTAVLIVCFVTMTVLSYVGTDEPNPVLLDNLPWCIPLFIGVSAVVYSITGIVLYSRCKKDELTPLAVKQFIDDIPAGLCFSNAMGRIILCNREMFRLSFALTGNYPQMLSELTKALQNPAADGVTVIDGDERIKADNETLRETNRKLQKLFDNMADTIREKESLELKVYIHDTLGRSLLTIQDIMDDNEDDVEKKLASLQEAVSVLSSNRPTFENTIGEVRQKAADMGVKVLLDGYIPSDTVMENLIVSAARECVTNCVRHAGGNEVTVRIREIVGVCTVTITNNGAVSEGEIVEGSGLSSLRRSVEVSGGEMHIASKPRFALILNLSRKELNP